MVSWIGLGGRGWTRPEWDVRSFEQVGTLGRCEEVGDVHHERRLRYHVNLVRGVLADEVAAVKGNLGAAICGTVRQADQQENNSEENK